MIVLDTTVLVYALGSDHPLREPCRDVLRHAARLQATTTTEVVQEFAHVYARRRSRAVAAAPARDYVRLLGPLLVSDDRALLDGLDLFESLPALGAFDSVLAATARRAGATAVVSADRGLAEVPGLVHVQPGSQEWATLRGPPDH